MKYNIEDQKDVNDSISSDKNIKFINSDENIKYT